MADDLSFRIVSRPTVNALKAVEREVQKANVAAVRAAGQALAQAEKRRAPVYQGSRRNVPKGRLRRSVRTGRIRRQGETATVAVGPGLGRDGWRVRVYAGKIEAEHPYVAPSVREMGPSLPAIAAAAYARAIAKGAR